jgi:hypothetical protein
VICTDERAATEVLLNRTRFRVIVEPIPDVSAPAREPS